MFCTKCGNTISKETKFCTKCGAPVANNSVSGKREVPAKSKKSGILVNLLFVLLSLLIIALIAGMGYFVFKNFPSPFSSNKTVEHEETEWKTEKSKDDDEKKEEEDTSSNSKEEGSMSQEQEETSGAEQPSKTEVQPGQSIENGIQPSQPPNSAMAGFMISDSAVRYLAKEDLYGLSKEQLRIARNEIYARHGRKFKDEALQDYFNSQEWYMPLIEADEFDKMVKLSDVERKNLDLIKSVENSMP
ncbi:YARHG domain-containing protein [Filifactor villosus]|uniref:YARHG domain-containing protein n=1 Tax=Filifactor villosus TaxID=29374 RepID=A0ABV9QP92_9FIRM